MMKILNKMIKRCLSLRSTLSLSKYRYSSQSIQHANSLAHPTQFWDQKAKDIIWHKPYDTVFAKDASPMGYSWFKGGQLNTCFNALDRHVLNGLGDKQALIYDSGVTGTQSFYTYSALLRHVQVFSKVLLDHGLDSQDTVLIYMPMIPQAVIAMLACARLGIMHSVVFGGFSSKELAKRLEDCKPKAVLLASCGIEPSKIVPYKPLMDAAIDLCTHKPAVRIVFQRDQLNASLSNGYLDWSKQVSRAEKSRILPEAVPVDSSHPLYLLYTSGSTGTPKGIVRDTGGHAVALHFATQMYGIFPGKVMLASSDVGWILGHSYTVYGPLLVGATTVLYEGKPVGTPDAGVYWRMIQDYKINMLFCAPTAIRAIQREDPKGQLIQKYDISSLENVYLAGERTDLHTIQHWSDLLRVPIRDNYWQTETGWPITSTSAKVPSHSIQGTETRFGSAGMVVPGYKLVALASDDADMDEYLPELTHSSSISSTQTIKEVEPNRAGNLAIALPLPPGTLIDVWNAPGRLFSSYLSKFPGYFDLTDAGYIDQDGYVHLLSRTDDVMNVAGHRLSTGGLEEVVSSHPLVAECAVVSTRDALKGDVPLAFVVLSKNLQVNDQIIIKQIKDSVREHVGAFASLKNVVIVDKLPKTRSGKVSRVLLRALGNGDEFTIPATLEDESVLDQIQLALKQ